MNKKHVIVRFFAIFFASLLIFNGAVEVKAAETNITSVSYENAENLDNQLQSTDCITNNLNQSNTLTSSITSNTTGEKKIVDNIVLFITFKGQADVYAERGGYQYIMNQIEGMGNYIKEVSEDQVNVNNIFPQLDSNNSINFYEDIQPKEYYMKYSDTNPIGYKDTGEFRGSDRRTELLNRVLDYVGNDFLKYLKDVNKDYRFTFIVPECEDWNDLLWSCKSTTQVLGKTVDCTFVTAQYGYGNTETFSHEFLHALGFPDMYRYNFSGTAVGPWSIMEYGFGYPTVYERLKYGGWIQNSGAIKEITKDGQYVLSPASSGQLNTIAYKIPIPGADKQYFMVEYRGSGIGNYEKNLREGLIVYRVDEEIQGNLAGPPDEVHVLAKEGQSIFDAYLDGTVGRDSFSDFKLYNSVQDLGINISNVKKLDGKMYFNISMTSNDKVTAPTNLTISQTDDNNIDLKWTHSNNLREFYQVYRDGKFIGTTKSNSYTDNFSIEAGKTYSYQIKSFSSELGQSSDSLSASVIAKDMLTIDSVVFDKDYVTLGDSVNIKINAHGGVGQLQYKVYYWMPWGDIVIQDYSTNSNINWRPDASTAWRMRILVKDEAGNTKQINKDFHVYDPLQVKTFTADKESPQKLGTRIKLSADIALTGSAIEVDKQNLYKFYYKLDGNTVVIQDSGKENQTYFTPKKPGNYILGVAVTDLVTKEVTTKEIEYKVTGELQTTIYYSGYSNPYIHYKVGSGTWTSVPGVKMQASNEVPGYTHKITINLGDADNLTACFNNGSGTWDNNGGANYSFGVGTFTYESGKITPITIDNKLSVVSITADKTSPQFAGTAINLASTATGNGTLMYRYMVYRDSKLIEDRDYSTTNNFTWTPTTEGTYTLYCKVKDDTGKEVLKSMDYVINKELTVDSFNTSVASPQVTGTAITLNTAGSGGIGTLQSKFVVFDGTNYTTIKEYTTAGNSVIWNPTKAGTYTLYSYLKDESGTEVAKTMTYVITDPKLEITSFTGNLASPQLAGTAINLASTATGKGTLMYRFAVYQGSTFMEARDYSTTNNFTWTPTTAGTYTLYCKVKDDTGIEVLKSITYVISDPKPEITSFTVNLASPQVPGTAINLASTATGKGTLMYRFAVYQGSTFMEARDYSTTNNFTWTPTAAGTYTLYCKVKDDTGIEVLKSITYVIN